MSSEGNNKRDREEGDNDSVASEAAAQKEPKKSKYNSGKWTNEECEYMLGLMEAFKAGHLPLREGTTLRSFLSSMMKCKPKRISKKFEGISYNGRLVYQKSKEPISIQAAMLLRARLSELERRYLAAAAEQREGNDSIDALLRQSSQNQDQKPSAAQAPTVLEHQPQQVAGVFSSLSQTDPRVAPRLSEATAPALGLGGVGAGMAASGLNNVGGPKLSDDDVSRLLAGGQRPGLTAAGLRGMDPSLLNSMSNNTSLMSAGLASSTGAYRNLNLLAQRPTLAHTQAEFPSPPPSQSVIGDFHAHLERQKQLGSLSNTSTASTLAAMQLRERTLANNMAQISQPPASSLSLAGLQHHNDVLPSVGSSATAFGNATSGVASLPPRYPVEATTTTTSSVQHSLDINRYVLQSPQDDASYFRQRLLPGVSSRQNPADGLQTRLSNASAARAGRPTGDLSSGLHSLASSNAGTLAELLARQEKGKY